MTLNPAFIFLLSIISLAASFLALRDAHQTKVAALRRAEQTAALAEALADHLEGCAAREAE